MKTNTFIICSLVFILLFDWRGIYGQEIVCDLRAFIAESKSSQPTDLKFINGFTYFVADDGIHGGELWKSDGTKEGTILVKDINPGPGDSFASWITRFNSTLLFFAATDGTHGLALWKSDGTAEGTSMVKILNANSNSPYTPGWGFGISDIVILNGSLLFQADNGVNGTELWKSDGTAEGTMLIKDINPGPSSSLDFLTQFVIIDNSVFFSALDGNTGRELWKSDGTAAGTVLIKDINPGSNSSLDNTTSFVVLGSSIFFSAGNETNKKDVWKSDGTSTGTSVVKTIGATSIESLTKVNNQIYFIVKVSYFESELWKSDGTASGTSYIKGKTDGLLNIYGLQSGLGKLFFLGNDGTNGSELWSSDGSANGTFMVKDINTSTENHINSITEKDGNLILFTSNGEIWKTDGSESGTMLVKSTRGDDYPRNTYSIHEILNINGTIFFTTYANIGEGHLLEGSELWRTDGTAEGTYLVKRIDSPFNGPYSAIVPIGSLINANGVLLFNAYDKPTGSELWQSDGTSNGTFMTKDINNQLLSVPDKAFQIKGHILFKANNNLWATDGPANGALIKSGVEELVFDSTKNVLYFSNGGSIFRTEGELTNTLAIYNGSLPRSLTIVNGNLFFADGANLWVSDGTEIGTKHLKDINTGQSFYSIPINLVAVNGTLFFCPYGRGEIWKSDGTPEGTVAIKNDISVAVDYSPENLTSINDRLFFTVKNSSNTQQLWKSDGSANGTLMIQDIHNDPRSLIRVGDRFFFITNPDELWISNGTPAGSQLIKTLPGISYALNLIALENSLFIWTSEFHEGNILLRLFTSEGSSEGTKQLAEIPIGNEEWTPMVMPIVFNDLIIFVAAGKLWKTNGETVSPISLGINDSVKGFIANFKSSELHFLAGTKIYKMTKDQLITEIADHEEKKVTVYPNPAQDKISISSNQHIDKFTITDLFGRTVLNLKNIGQNELTCDVRGLISAIYVVQIMLSDSTCHTMRIIVNH